MRISTIQGICYMRISTNQGICYRAGRDAVDDIYYYYAPWARFHTYGVGLVVGYIIWKCKGKLKLPVVGVNRKTKPARGRCAQKN